MSIHVRDDRGMRMPWVLDSAALQGLAPEIKRTMYRSSFEKWWWWYLGCTTANVAGTLLWRAYHNATSQFPEITPLHIVIVRAIMVPLPFQIGLFLFLRSRRVRGERAMCLNHQRCPACLYSISGIATESDGCRVCPECGGAWRLPDTVNGTSHA